LGHRLSSVAPSTSDLFVHFLIQRLVSLFFFLLSIPLPFRDDLFIQRPLTALRRRLLVGIR
jgi:hypothetical protein